MPSAGRRRDRAGDDVVAAEEPRALDLGHHSDSSGGQLEDLLERRDPVLPELREAVARAAAP